jgi:hypothetical protein
VCVIADGVNEEQYRELEFGAEYHEMEPEEPYHEQELPEGFEIQPISLIFKLHCFTAGT